MTEEDRKRIEEEEEYRRKLHEEEVYRTELRSKDVHKNNGINIFLLIPLLIIIPIMVTYYYEFNLAYGLFAGILLSVISIILKKQKK